MALLEFGAGEDHVHLLVSIHPALNISTLMNNLKTATARRAQPVSAASRAVLREAVFLAPGLLCGQRRRRFSGGGETVRRQPESGGTPAVPLPPSRLAPRQGNA